MCKSIVAIPQAQQPKAVLTAPAGQGSGESAAISSIITDAGLSFPDILETDRIDRELQPQQTPSAVDDARMFQKQKSSAESRSTGRRKFPWPIDIFLYPISGACIAQLVIFLGIPFLIGLVTLALGPILGIFVGIPGIVVMLIIFAYMAWYVCECIRDSGGGGVRAPDAMMTGPDLFEAFGQIFRIIGGHLFFLAPMILYFSFTRRVDSFFWILTTVGAFFFPMGLLAVTMFDSMSGLNPILLVGSVARVFLPYCAMIAILAAMVFLTAFLSAMMGALGLRTIIIRCVATYLMLVTAHLLGRFYYHNADKLDWGM